MMRTLYTSLALIIAQASSAQLVNGSFESSLGFDYTGWQFDCSAPTAVHNTPLGGGEWSARKEIGNVKGCWPSYLYQPISFAQNGEIWTLSAWTRSDTVGITANASVCFGHQLGGIITLQENTSYSGFDWTFISITDTIIAGPGETPLAILNPGITAGPTFGAAWFDNVQLVHVIAENVNEKALSLQQFFDEVNSMLYVSLGDRVIRDARLFDLTGRAIAANMHGIGSRNASVDLRTFGAGVYIVQVSTDAGQVAARFVKP